LENAKVAEASDDVGEQNQPQEDDQSLLKKRSNDAFLTKQPNKKVNVSFGQTDNPEPTQDPEQKEEEPPKSNDIYSLILAKKFNSKEVNKEVLP
jgi:hypothetical protein